MTGQSVQCVPCLSHQPGGALRCWKLASRAVRLDSMIKNQLMVLGPGLHKSIAFNGVDCSSCLGLGSSPDRSSGTARACMSKA